MSRRFGTERILIANGSISGVAGAIIPAQEGFIVGINQIIASNQLGSLASITFYDGGTRITPSMTLGASGTLIIDNFGGSQLELSIGSGLFGSSVVAGDTQVSIYYTLYDESPGVTKIASRAASLSPITTRALRNS